MMHLGLKTEEKSPAMQVGDSIRPSLTVRLALPKRARQKKNESSSKSLIQKAGNLALTFSAKAVKATMKDQLNQTKKLISSSLKGIEKFTPIPPEKYKEVIEKAYTSKSATNEAKSIAKYSGVLEDPEAKQGFNEVMEAIAQNRKDGAEAVMDALTDMLDSSEASSDTVQPGEDEKSHSLVLKGNFGGKVYGVELYLQSASTQVATEISKEINGK